MTMQEMSKLDTASEMLAKCIAQEEANLFQIEAAIKASMERLNSLKDAQRAMKRFLDSATLENQNDTF